MFFRSLLISAAAFMMLTACSHSGSPKSNITSVKTSFILLAGPQKPGTQVVQAGEPFLERQIRPEIAATLTEDFTYQSDKRTKQIPKGTQLFGSYEIYQRPVIPFSSSLPDATAAPPLTLGGTSTQSQSDADRATSTLFAKLQNRQTVRKARGFAVYCGLMSTKYDGGDMLGAVFTLGLNLARKNKDVFCLQDTNNDGKFDRVWDGNLSYSFPPTVDKIYNDRLIEPVGFEQVKQEEIAPIGSLWLQLGNQGFLKGDLHVNSRLGRDGKYVEFDNQRKNLAIGSDGKTTEQSFFGASYVIEETHSGHHKRIHFTPAKMDVPISLSKTVYYRQTTTYIPIFVPR